MNRRIISLLMGCVAALWVEAQTGNFRFVQLTDIHLSPHNPQPTEDLLKSIAQINAMERVDFVLVTGDITEEGDRACLLKAKECLSLLKVPCYTIMGNHETKWSESGCTAFGEIFGGERFEFEHKGVLFLGFNSGPLMRMALGHVAPQDIRWMKEEMERHGKDNPVVLVTHYPMLPGDVDNHYEVTDAVRKYNVRLFIGGHYHRFRNLTYDDIPGVLTRSNLRGKEGKGGYGLFEVEGDSLRVYEQRIGEKPVWRASFSLQDRLYDPNGESAHYPDYSVNNTYKKTKSLWNLATGTAIYSSPAIEGEHLFVGNDEGRLTAYRLKDGKELWHFEARGRIVGAPAAAQGKVVFGSADGYIYGLDSQNGEQAWRVETKAPVLGAVTIADGVAYIGGSDGCMRAIDLISGQVVWCYDQVKGYIETRPLLTQDKVIFGAWDNTLYALDRTRGTALWKWTGGLTRMHFSPAAVWPVATDDRLFIADPERALTAIGLKEGTTLYRTYQSTVRESIGLSEDSKRVYGKTMNDSIVCYDATTSASRQLWATNVGFGYEHAPAMLTEREGVVYGCTKEGVIFALDAMTGRIRWVHKIGNSLVNTIVPLGKRRVAYTSTDGQVGILVSD